MKSIIIGVFSAMIAMTLINIGYYFGTLERLKTNETLLQNISDAGDYYNKYLLNKCVLRLKESNIKWQPTQ